MGPPRQVILRCAHALVAELPVMECEVHAGEWIVSLRDIYRATRGDVALKDGYALWVRNVRKAPGFKGLRHMEHGKALLWCPLPAALALMVAPLDPVSKETWVWMGYLFSADFARFALAEGLLAEGGGAAEAAEVNAPLPPRKRRREPKLDQLPPAAAEREAPAAEGVVGLVKKMGARKCTYEGCLKHSSFGWVGGVRSRCKQHHEAGMIRLSGARCSEPACPRQASFGWPNQKPLKCRSHSLPGMADRVSRLCAAPGCSAHPSYSFPGQRPFFCAPHAEEGMENVISPRCDGPGCKKRPSYGWPNQRNTRCKLHAEDGMFDQNHDKRTQYRAEVRKRKDEEELKSNGVVNEVKRRGRPRKVPIGKAPSSTPVDDLQRPVLEHPPTKTSDQGDTQRNGYNHTIT